MKTQMGEYLVGAYLKVIEQCDFVDYNVRPPGGGMEGLNELDVVGFHFGEKTAYLCEVTTHIRGLQYGNNKETVQRITRKHRLQRRYARKNLQAFSNHRFMLWSPVVPVGYITEALEKLPDLEFVFNKQYAQCVDKLRQRAKAMTNDIGNPFFRSLQILEHLRVG